MVKEHDMSSRKPKDRIRAQNNRAKVSIFTSYWRVTVHN